jgi:hypothetical protein
VERESRIVSLRGKRVQNWELPWKEGPELGASVERESRIREFSKISTLNFQLVYLWHVYVYGKSMKMNTTREATSCEVTR